MNRGGDRSPAIASPQTASAGNNGPSRSFRETGQRQEAGNRQDSRAESRAFQATVRIKVEDEKGFSFGTGTIIDVHKQEALIITCGHLFRESRGRGQILVDLNVPNARQPVRAELIAWDAGKRDIAVLSIRPNVPVVAVPVAGQRVNPRRGQAVFSVGCDQGRPATIRRSHIVTVNRYQGPANIEVQGHPSVGRSGGGLFNQEGQLIGVCRAADLEEDQGIYGGLPVIYGQLDRIHQSHLYRDRQPRVLEAGPSRLAGNRSDRGPQGDSLRAMPASRPQPTASADRPTELICIVRDANGKQRTIVVRDPSAQLVRQVQDAAGNSQLARRDRAPDDNRPLTIRGQDVR